MKKIILFLIMAIGMITSAKADEFLDNVVDMAKKALPIHDKLETCTPINFDYFQIYGLENNKCHFKHVYYDCYAPIEITHKVAQNSRKAALDIINNGNFSTRATTSETKYNEDFFNNKMYCSTNY